MTHDEMLSCEADVLKELRKARTAVEKWRDFYDASIRYHMVSQMAKEMAVELERLAKA